MDSKLIIAYHVNVHPQTIAFMFSEVLEWAWWVYMLSPPCLGYVWWSLCAPFPFPGDARASNVYLDFFQIMFQ